MRNHQKQARALGAAVVAAVAALSFSAAQANAAQWTPAGLLTTGNATHVSFTAGASMFWCTGSAMTLRVGDDGSVARTEPASGGVTFSGCTASGLAGGLPVTVTMSGRWHVRPTSTTTAAIELPANSLKINVATGTVLACTITLGPGALNRPVSWSNPSHALGFGSGSVPFHSTGGYCGGSGNITPSSNSGWYFPALSII